MREMNVLATGHVSFFERMEGVGKPKDLNEGRMERSGTRWLELRLGILRFRFQYSRISFNFSISILIFCQVV